MIYTIESLNVFYYQQAPQLAQLQALLPVQQQAPPQVQQQAPQQAHQLQLQALHHRHAVRVSFNDK